MRLLVLVVQVCLTLRSVQPRDSRPNIILILTDDQVTSVSECLMSQVSLAFLSGCRTRLTGLHASPAPAPGLPGSDLQEWLREHSDVLPLQILHADRYSLYFDV